MLTRLRRESMAQGVRACYSACLQNRFCRGARCRSTPATLSLDLRHAAGTNEAVVGAAYQLTVGASDPGADTISLIHVDWGDGESSSTAASSATLSHTYTAEGVFDVLVTVTDEDGSYALPSFVIVESGASPSSAHSASSFADPIPNSKNYDRLFENATPHLNQLDTEYDIHHTKPARLADRYLAEQGINVHENRYLRAVPRDIHVKEITPAWNRWCNYHVREGTWGPDREAFFNSVPLDEVDNFMDQVHANVEADWFVEAGADKKRIKQVGTNFKTKRGKFLAGKAKRLKDLGFIIGAYSLFQLFTENAKAAQVIVNHDPAANAALQEFENQYDITLDSAIDNGWVTRTQAEKLINAFIGYAQALQLDGQTLDGVRTVLYKQVLSSPDLRDD